MEVTKRTKLEERLIQLRTENGLSQGDLAERMHVSRQTISRWENGATIPSAESIRLLSQLYGISADALLHGEPPAAEPEAHESEPVGPEPEAAAPARPGSRRKLAVLLVVVFVVGVIVGMIWWSSKKNNADDNILMIGNMEGTSIEPDAFFDLLPME